MLQEPIPNFDFLLAKLKHIDWRIRLLAFLEGEKVISQEEIVSPHCCELGCWLDNEGLAKYKHWQEIQELERLHNHLHTIGEQLIRHQKEGLLCVEKEYEKLQEISTKIIEILENLEQKTKK